MIVEEHRTRNVNCGKTGHWKEYCRAQKDNAKAEVPSRRSRGGSRGSYHRRGGHRNNSNNVRNLNEESSDENEYFFQIGCDHQLFPIRCGETELDVLIDSGSRLNIIDERDLAMLDPKPVLKRSGTRIFAYDSSRPLTVLGSFNTMVGSDNYNKVNAKFHVVRGDGGSILGKKTAIELDLLRVGPQTNYNVVAPLDSLSPEIKKIIDEHKEVFQGIGKLKDFQLKLHVDPNAPPVQQSFRRIPFHTRKKVEDELFRLEALGIIERVEGPTTWVNQMVVTERSNGRVRICLDMRDANKAIIRERHIIPKVDECLAELHGAKFFTKLDLKDGYHQLELHPDCRDLTTFMTHKGLFRFTRLLYGVNSGFECFQKQIEQLLAGIPNVLNISDDIFIFGKTEEEHNIALTNVLKRLINAGITLNPDKCEFLVQEVVFAGHRITPDGISLQESRVKSISNLKQPTNESEVRSFLGMVNYCNKFIPNYSTITAPLRKLTKKGEKFVWGDEQQSAFDELKTRLTKC